MEKQIEYKLIAEKYWERTSILASLNPAVTVPVLVDGDQIICDVIPIIEYLEDKYTDIKFLSDNIEHNAEIRRISCWFNIKFYYEVTRYIIQEKIIRSFQSGTPNSEAIRAGKSNMLSHLDYIGFLLRKNKWLASEYITIADFSAATQLSVLDYLGDVPWEYNKDAKEWYSIIKSRPSFRDLFKERISGFNPSANYVELDF